jgi:hypothetical protein
VEQLVGQVTKVTTPNPAITAVFTNGVVIISNTVTLPNNPGFVESHSIRVAATDTAGNRTESDSILIFVQHALKK